MYLNVILFELYPSMEHKSQISIINVTRSFQEGDRADTYRDLVVQGTCFNPDRHRVETITRSELMTPEAVWQKLLKSKLLASSGSNDNVGEPLKGPEADLEPNLESAVVRNLVSVYQFLVLKTHQGDDPSLRELHGILNCFSAQALSYAIMLVVCLVRRKADLSKVHDIRDMMQKYPIEEISADPQFRFQLRKACASQVGVLPVEILDSHHWAVQGLPQQPNMLFLHNQTILSEVLQEAVGVIRTVQIFAERKLKVFHRGRQERKTIVTGFSVGNLTALQAHVDYG